MEIQSQTLSWVLNVLMVLAPLWVLGGIIVSVVYRRMHGKPVLTPAPPGAVFVERWVSGQPLGSWRAIGGARNALMVAVTREGLVIRPCFPFNLMFLPEIWGLEAEVPRRDVLSILPAGKALDIRIRDGGRERVFRLELRDPVRFQGSWAVARE